MRRNWCAAAMVLCGVMLASSRARAQEIGSFRVRGYYAGVGRHATAMAGDGRFMVVWRDADHSATSHIRARFFEASGQPAGSEFVVAPWSVSPAVAASPAGVFTVVWVPRDSPGPSQVRGQRFAAGVPLGAEFVVNSETGYTISDTAMAADAAGNTVVAWTRGFGPTGSAANGARVRARRFDAAGAPLGAEFQVNTYTGGHQLMPSVAFQQGGGFVVAWHGTRGDGSAESVFAQRYLAAGTPLGGELRVNTSTAGIQAFTCVAPAGNGGFVVGWLSAISRDRAAAVRVRRFDAEGNPLGPDFRVNGHIHVRFGPHHACSAAPDAQGGFAIAWAGQDDEFNGIPGQANLRRYDAVGAALGPVVMVAPESFRSVLSTVLLGNGAGRFVLAWSDRTAGNGFDQVNGRLYQFTPGLALEDPDNLH